MRQKGESQKSKLKKKARRRSSSEKRAGPVQLSKYMKDHDDAQRSAVTGKIIKLKVKKSTKDKERDLNRKQLLEFLNNQ